MNISRDSLPNDISGNQEQALDMTRSLACLGNAADIRAWSNIPFHFFQAANPAGFLTHALNLDDPHYRWHRTLWEIRQALEAGNLRGYQSSRECAKRMWRSIPEGLRKGEIISHFQTFPCTEDAAKDGCRFSFYCDATLTQFWEGTATPFGKRRTAEIIKREGEGYRQAYKVIAMSRCCADSFVCRYGVDAAKVHIVRPGANLNESDVRAFLRKRGRSWREGNVDFTRKNPAKLGFIGIDYQRKGLLRLIDAAKILQDRGYPVKVVVIGGCPEEQKKNPLVEYAGRINKRDDLDRFLSVVESFAMGCLPSYSEPLGISTLECLRLGVPVFGTNVGGIPDCIASPYGLMVDGTVDSETIAGVLQENVFDPGRYQTLVKGAVQEMPKTTWMNAVSEFMRIWGETE